MARVRIKVPLEDESAQKKSDISLVPDIPRPTVQRKGSILKRSLLITAGILLFIFMFNLINERNRLQKELATNTDSQNTEEIVKILSKGIEIPEDEIPNTRTLDEAAVQALARQNPALADLKVGDTLMLFEKSSKIVIYRPSTKKAVVVIKYVPQTSQSPSQQNPN